jgi:hypothetical protein
LTQTYVIPPKTETEGEQQRWRETLALRVNKNSVYVEGNTALTAATGAYTILSTDFFVKCTGTFTVTLPTAVGVSAKHYHIKNAGTGTITIDGNGTETIDDALTLVLAPMDSAHVISDNVEWWTI